MDDIILSQKLLLGSKIISISASISDAIRKPFHKHKTKFIKEVSDKKFLLTKVLLEKYVFKKKKTKFQIFGDQIYMYFQAGA